MTPLEAFTSLAHLVIPTLGVLAFLLLYRRQSFQAELDELRMRQDHSQMLRLAEAKSREAQMSVLAALGPVVGQAIEQLGTKLSAKGPRVAARELYDVELIDELERRFAEGERHGPRPDNYDPACTGCDADAPPIN